MAATTAEGWAQTRSVSPWMLESDVATPERVEYHTSRFGSGAEVEAHLSWLQSRMSTERTLMSLARFSITLIGLGFTIVEYLNHVVAPGGTAAASELPRFFGLGMIAVGTLLAVVALWQYRTLMSFLWSPDYQPIAGIEGYPARIS